MIRRNGLAPVVLLLAALLASCGRHTEHDPRTLVIARAADNVSLDPAVSLNAGDGTIIALCYQRLTAINPRSPDGAAVGELAQSWNVSADGLKWTFRLRPGQRFASGDPVTSDDVVQSFERVARIGRGPAQGLFWLKAASAPDPLTVEFALNMPFPVLPKILSLSSASIVDMKALRAHETGKDHGVPWLSEHCAGSGPYGLRAWLRGQRLVLAADPQYSGVRPWFKNVEFKIVPDASSRRAQMSKGDIDLIDGVGAAEAGHYGEMRGVRLAKASASNTLYYLTMNNANAVLSDVRVRQAIAKAIDYRAIRERLLDGNAVLMRELIPPGVPGFDPAIPEPRRDLTAARALLKAAGHQDGLHLTMLIGDQGPIAELIQADLAEAGIDLSLQRMAPAALDAARTSGNFDVVYDGWVLDFPDPFIYLNLVFSSPQAGGVGNFSHYRNAQVGRLLQSAMITADPDRRAALYAQAQRLIMADEPIVPLFLPMTIFAERATLTGVRVNPYQPNYLNIVDMARVPS